MSYSEEGDRDRGPYGSLDSQFTQSKAFASTSNLQQRQSQNDLVYLAVDSYARLYCMYVCIDTYIHTRIHTYI